MKPQWAQQAHSWGGIHGQTKTIHVLTFVMIQMFKALSGGVRR
mgnify:CR=1 FL=1